MSEDDSDNWELQRGDTIVEDETFAPSFEAVGNSASGIEHTVTHRLKDQDTGDRFYQTEYDSGDGPETQLQNAEMIHDLFRETAAPTGGSADAE